MKNTLNIEVLDKHSRTNVSLDPRMILLLIIAVELYYNSLIYMYNWSFVYNPILELNVTV